MAHRKDLIITIDGPSGAGKSTIAKMLAQKLDYSYIDTGAMYRGVAYAYKTKIGTQPVDGATTSQTLAPGIAELLKDLQIRFEFKNETKVFLDGINISRAIRTPEISLLASALSQQKIVREYLYRIQREIGKNGGVVLEGRDTGSVVFPNAQIKIYLDAHTEERAKRRHLELKAKGNAEALGKVKEEMVLRDKNDSERDIAPLIMPENALYIDTTGIDIAGVISSILKHITNRRGPMKVLKTKNIGFCFGVKRAVKMVLKEAAAAKDMVYTVGPIIHNPQMVNILKEKGVVPVNDIFHIKSGTVVFRTHGIRKDEEEYIKKTGLKIIDTTCPFVKRVRQHAMYLKKMGYTVVIIGDKNHPEVKSVLSYLDNDGIVLQEPARLDKEKVGVVCQTTLDKDTFVNIVKELIGGVEELRIYNTICESTEVRQKEAITLSGKVDMMLIVGGKNSSNTRKLYKVVHKVQPNTHHIETENNIKPDWFKEVHTVGITGGASTPDLIIDVVERRVKNF